MLLTTGYVTLEVPEQEVGRNECVGCFRRKKRYEEASEVYNERACFMSVFVCLYVILGLDESRLTKIHFYLRTSENKFSFHEEIYVKFKRTVYIAEYAIGNCLLNYFSRVLVEYQHSMQYEIRMHFLKQDENYRLNIL
jgi:hypothetical protein